MIYTHSCMNVMSRQGFRLWFCPVSFTVPLTNFDYYATRVRC